MDGEGQKEEVARVNKQRSGAQNRWAMKAMLLVASADKTKRITSFCERNKMVCQGLGKL